MWDRSSQKNLFCLNWIEKLLNFKLFAVFNGFYIEKSMEILKRFMEQNNSKLWFMLPETRYMFKYRTVPLVFWCFYEGGEEEHRYTIVKSIGYSLYQKRHIHNTNIFVHVPFFFKYIECLIFSFYLNICVKTILRTHFCTKKKYRVIKTIGAQIVHYIK